MADNVKGRSGVTKGSKIKATRRVKNTKTGKTKDVSTINATRRVKNTKTGETKNTPLKYKRIRKNTKKGD